MPVHSEGPTLLRMVHHAADTAMIDLVLMWGSLLGHVRDGGIIAHDYDIDLNMFARDIPKLGRFIALLQRSGLEVDIRSPYQITITQPNGRVFGIDIWIFYENGDHFVLYSFRSRGGLLRYDLPRKFFDETDVVDFLGTTCRIPRDAKTVLDLTYGDWKVRRPDFSEDDAPCATACSDYPESSHSIGQHVHYSRWGQPLRDWPPYSVVDVGTRVPDHAMFLSKGRTCTFDDFAGKYVFLCFFGSLSADLSKMAVAEIDAYVRRSGRADFVALCVSADARDRHTQQARELHDDLLLVCDNDRAMCRAFGALPNIMRDDVRQDFRLFLMLVSPQRHVLQIFRMADYRRAIMELDGLRPADTFLGFETPPPLTFFPNLLEDELCERLIAEFKSANGESDLDRLAPKPSRDGILERPADTTTVMDTVSARIGTIVVTELERIFSLKARWPSEPRVMRFDELNSGLGATRDNTEPSQSHRRYKVIISLNAVSSGGEDRFPEYGSRSYSTRKGTGVLFPCTIAHEMTPIISGSRYICVCYLTDDEGIRSYGAYLRTVEFDAQT